MLTQAQNDRIGEETEAFYADMEMEMLEESARHLSRLEQDASGKIPWVDIIATATALLAAHRGIVNGYASKVGEYVNRDTYGAFMLNGATEATPETAAWILQDARDRATAAAPAIISTIQGRSQYIVNTANTAYLNAASRAAAQVRAGTNAKVAVERAVSDLARRGVTYSEYTRMVNGFPQKVRVPVDVGIRRAIRTNVCQELGDQIIGICNETGVNLVEVDFSTNPRESHADWEGQVYQLNGAGEFQNFYIACRVGDPVDGFGGYNCQHNIAPYTGYRHFTDPLKGTGYTREEAYALSQRQRYFENEIRKDKRERDVLREVGLPTRAVNARLANHQRQLDSLVSAHPILHEQSWRTRVYAAASEIEQSVIIERALRNEIMTSGPPRYHNIGGKSRVYSMETVKERLPSRQQVKALQAASDEAYTVMSDEARRSLRKYTSEGGHNIVNMYLAGASTEGYVIAEGERLRRGLREAVSNYRLPESVTVVSGTKAKHYAGYKAGQVKEVATFISGTTDLREAMAFYRRAELQGEAPMLLEIIVPQGTPCIYIGNNTDWVKNQWELLLRDGIKYRVLEVADDKITLEVILES